MHEIRMILVKVKDVRLLQELPKALDIFSNPLLNCSRSSCSVADVELPDEKLRDVEGLDMTVSSAAVPVTNGYGTEVAVGPVVM